jgi:hypothetical protein
VSKKELDTLVGVWRDYLRLGHWKIEAAFQSGEDMGGRDAAVTAQAEYDQAVMAVRQPTDSQPVDVEESVVHELLHVLLEGHKNLTNSTHEDTYDPMYERGLNVLAGLLVALRRAEQSAHSSSPGRRALRKGKD